MVLLVLSASFGGSGALVAQESSVRAYVTPGTTVAVGGAFVLNVEITGTQRVDRNPQLPDVSAFAQYLSNSTQSSMQTVNGRSSVSLTIQYRYQALTAGSFTIPSFEVAAGGRIHSTKAIDLSVSTAGVTAGSDQGTGIGPDDLFITASASRPSVRVGEPFIVEYLIWTRIDVTNFGMTSVPEPEGFWVEDITPSGQPAVEQRVRDGVQYATAVIRRVALIPTGPGERAIEPIGVEAQIRVRGVRDTFRDFFGRSSLFGASTVPTTVLSNPLVIRVESLPPGRPDPFSGVVGSLTVSSSLDRDSVDANDAVTLTVRVSGSGNIRAVPAPEVAFPPDFEVFPPEISEAVEATETGLSGSKTFEYVLIPRAPGRREIPAVSFAYFDAIAGGYRTAESSALPLTVAGTVVEGPSALARAGVSQLRQDIRFIRLGPLELRRSNRSIFGGGFFWLFALLPLTAVAGAVALRRHFDLLEGDVAYARGRRAGRVAKRRLAEARRLARGDDSRAFHAEVARALVGLAADRLNLAEAGVQNAELDRALAAAGVEDAVRAEVRACLEQCDRQRFAPTGTTPSDAERFLDRVGGLMTALDRAVR